MKFRLIIDKTEEEEIIARVHERSSLTEQIEALVLNYAGTDRIYGFAEDEIKLLKFSQIECITVLDGKIYAIDNHAERYRLKQRLYELEEILPTYFFRINKSTFANENSLERFSASFNGAVDAIFKCGYQDYVSRRCFAAIKRRFDKK
ncbi:MAG: LytTR family transcriptional regulator [Ruminococcaceae bacterium]|nr:LytTR family transcriptional regulator [Oscillospiraceae bacterium]